MLFRSLAGIPRPSTVGNEPYRDALVEQRVDGRAANVGVRARVSLPDGDSHSEEGFRILDDDPGTLHRDSSERVVRLTVFDQDGHSGVPAKIDGLLRLGFGLEPDLAVDYLEHNTDHDRKNVV